MSFKKLIKPVCVLLSFTFAASLIAFGYYWNAERQVPGFEAVRGSYKKSDAMLVDRNGVVIHEMRIDENGRRLDWAGLKDISPALASAAILSEDRRFYNHNGVDWLGVSSAMIKSPFTGRTRGASTITMQLASILDRGLQGQGYKRTIRQKIGQIRYAAEIEKKWTKDQILEAYLNLVTFRGELQGVTAVSRGLFGKEPHGLNSKEALILASLVGANASLEVLAKRAYALENVMGTGVKAEEINVLMKEALTHPYLLKPSVALAPHAAAIVLKGGERGAIIRTTLVPTFSSLLPRSSKASSHSQGTECP
jgi:penicillin-binding protein 1C